MFVIYILYVFAVGYHYSDSQQQYIIEGGGRYLVCDSYLPEIERSEFSAQANIGLPQFISISTPNRPQIM